MDGEGRKVRTRICEFAVAAVLGSVAAAIGAVAGLLNALGGCPHV
jgi:hypothetical protein